MKRFIIFCISVLLLISFITSVYAADTGAIKSGDKVVIKDENWAYEKINNTYGYEIDEYIGSGVDVSLPYSFAKQYVTSIGSYAFNRKNVNNVETTYKIESIGEYAFNGCVELESVNLYDSLTSLGVGCFYGDTALKNVNLYATSVNSVPAYCFADCGIEEIRLPKTCTSIKNYAFYNCGSLKYVTIPESVTEIADNAFYGCGNNLVIVCNKDSYAVQYAQSKGINYILLGDANSDGKFNVRDATAIQYYKINQMNLTDYGKFCADVDHNGNINIRDVTYIQMKIAKIKVPDECF